MAEQKMVPAKRQAKQSKALEPETKFKALVNMILPSGCGLVAGEFAELLKSDLEHLEASFGDGLYKFILEK